MHWRTNFTAPQKGFIKSSPPPHTLFSAKRAACFESHGRENRQHPGVFLPAVDLRHGQTQPGGLQHGVPGGPPHSASAGAAHHAGGVLPLLLLSPCQRLLLLLLLWRLHGNGKVGNKEEKEFVQQRRRPVDLCQTGADDTRQGRPGHGVADYFQRSEDPGSGGAAERKRNLICMRLRTWEQNLTLLLWTNLVVFSLGMKIQIILFDIHKIL